MYGVHFLAHISPDNLGLININGSVVTPRPNRLWRVKPNAVVKDVGESCAGEPHAPFDGSELETELYQQRLPGMRPGLQQTAATAPVPYPTTTTILHYN